MPLFLKKPGQETSKDKPAVGVAPVQILGKPPAVGVISRMKLGASKGSSLRELILRFYKKDMAVITSALGVLLLAPIVEHFISAPGDSRSIGPGGGLNDPRFGAGSPFEPGAGGYGAPGSSANGVNNGRITPLNVRDPGYLIIPDRDDAIPKTADAAAPAPKDTGWSSTVKEAARDGAKAAFSASKSTVASKLTTALKGLGGGPSGGGSGAASASASALTPLSAKNVPHGSPTHSSLSSVVSAPGYKGVSARGASQVSGSIDSLRASASLQASLLNRNGTGAGGGSYEMVRDSLNSGGGMAAAGGGGYGASSPIAASDKKDGANPKDNKTEQKESLIYLRTKMEMEKSIDLKWKKKEWDEFGRDKMHDEENTKGSWQLKAAQVQANAQIAAAAIQAAGQVASAMIGAMGKGGGGGAPSPGQGQQVKEGNEGLGSAYSGDRVTNYEEGANEYLRSAEGVRREDDVKTSDWKDDEKGADKQLEVAEGGGDGSVG
ncbi:MAG: hypothetical protein HY078_14015 [Elusimicrobia bacterium]|nr:hypothetical protein [Elusimicrobiota bacterium]